MTCTAAEPGVTWAPPLLPPPVPRALGLKDIRIDLVLACFLLVSGLWLGLTGSVVGRNRVCRLLSGGKGAHASRERFPSLSPPPNLARVGITAPKTFGLGRLGAGIAWHALGDPSLLSSSPRAAGREERGEGGKRNRHKTKRNNQIKRILPYFPCRPIFSFWLFFFFGLTLGEDTPALFSFPIDIALLSNGIAPSVADNAGHPQKTYRHAAGGFTSNGYIYIDLREVGDEKKRGTKVDLDSGRHKGESPPTPRERWP